VERVGAQDNFVALGGDSVLAAQLVARVREAFAVDLPLISIFEEAATVGGMARVVKQAVEGGR
jgi:acyl carrier protein